MENPFLVAVSQSLQCHLKVWFYVCWWKKYVSVTNNCFKISLHELEDKMQISFVRECINQLDYIWVFKLFKQFNLSKCCKINPLLLLPKPNFLNSHCLSSLHIYSSDQSDKLKNTHLTFSIIFIIHIGKVIKTLKKILSPAFLQKTKQKNWNWKFLQFLSYN